MGSCAFLPPYADFLPEYQLTEYREWFECLGGKNGENLSQPRTEHLCPRTSPQDRLCLYRGAYGFPLGDGRRHPCGYRQLVDKKLFRPARDYGRNDGDGCRIFPHRAMEKRCFPRDRPRRSAHVCLSFQQGQSQAATSLPSQVA